MFDSIKRIGGEVVSKIKSKAKTIKENTEQQRRLKDFQDKLELAIASTNETIRDEREMIYMGTHDVDGNINNTRSQSTKRKKANNVVNMVYEFIESQVDSTIPQPSVRNKLRGNEELAKMIENSITNDLSELGITTINDVNERITPVQGYSAILVSWNPDFKHHLYRGEIELESVHPKRIIPQPGVWNLQKMDYLFVPSSVTKTYIKNRYDVDMENVSEQYPNVNSAGTNDNSQNNTEMVTEIVCWYKNDDGEISKFVWCDNEVLEDIPNFFARRINGEIVTEEKLVSEVTLLSGEVLPAGTMVPYFTPTRYPLVVRENVPMNFAFGGQSDVDVIRDQQDALKKVISTIEEKILRGSVIVKALEGHRFDLTNELYKVVKGNQAELAALGILNLSADITKDLEFAQQQYKSAQDTLGITNSYQGKQDATAISGVAKQIQVQQASGRMRSKQANKYGSFKELFEIIFEFKLAFYDELRPFAVTDIDGKDSYGDFDKYKFLVKDKAGQLYYNTDFIFSADAGAGLPRDKMWLFNSASDMFKSGAYVPGPAAITFWQQLDSQKYPNAGAILKNLEQQYKVELESRAKATTPRETINFKDLDPAAKQKMLEKTGISVPVESITATDKINTTVSFETMPADSQQKILDKMGIGSQMGQPMQQNQEQDVQQIIQEAMQNMTPEEQMQFRNAPDEVKIQILEQIMEANQNG